MSSTQVEAQAIVQPQAAEGTAAADVDPTTAAAAALSVFAPADAAAKELKLTEIRAATSRKMFDSVDADNSGFIEYDEFQRLCRKLDVTMSANDMKLAMSLLDEDSSGAISFEEFSAWWSGASPAENLRRLREAVAKQVGGGGDGSDAPFSFSKQAADAAMKKDLESDPATLAMIAEMRAGLDASVPDYLKGAPSHENSASDATTKVLDTRRLQELDTVFKSFDKDGNGMIDADELRELTIALGGPMDAAACARAMKEIDDDNSGSIELSELRQWLAVHHTDVTEEGSLAVALRSEVDKVLRIQASLDAELAAFFSSDEEGS